MTRYQVLFSQTAVDDFLRLKKSDRREVVREIGRRAEFPRRDPVITYSNLLNTCAVRVGQVEITIEFNDGLETLIVKSIDRI